MTQDLDLDAVARSIVDTNRFMALGTADRSGTPWVSPVWYAPATPSQFLWVSRPEARHSQNIAARPRIAIVIFDSTVPIGAAEALYVEAVAEQLLGAEAKGAIVTYSERSLACGAKPWEVLDVLPPAAFRLYRATATSQFVLGRGDRRLPVMPSTSR